MTFREYFTSTSETSILHEKDETFKCLRKYFLRCKVNIGVEIQRIKERPD